MTNKTREQILKIMHMASVQARWPNEEAVQKIIAHWGVTEILAIAIKSPEAAEYWKGKLMEELDRVLKEAQSDE